MSINRPKSHLTSALSFVVLVFVAWWAITQSTPSGELIDNQDLNEWSTSRAMDHVQSLSKEPHYVGSAGHERTREYIIQELEKLGISPQIQSGYTLDQYGNLAYASNIIARVAGSNSTNAVVVMSHYDSDPHSSLGASDAASGVATILEGVRAILHSNKSLKNDLIICITDGEELGLNGAQLFVEKHPWAKEVGMALNFEARGSGGPSYMLVETNGGNQKIINAFKNAQVPHPVANSLAYSIYKMIPNDTDLTVFREKGDINGLNFAFIGDHYDYHTQLDTYDRLDTNTLAHQGSYFMAMVNELGNADLSDKLKANPGEDLVYFPLPIIGLVTFPFNWLAGLIIGTGLLLIVVISYGIKIKKIKPVGIIVSFSLFLGLLGLSLFPILINNFLKDGVFYADQLHGFPYNGYWWISCVALLACAIVFFVYHKFYTPQNIASLSIGPLLFLWLVCLLIAFPTGDAGILDGVYLPGAGFFIIPVILGSLLLLLNIRQNRPSYLVLILLSIPALFIFTPFIKAFPVALGMKILFVASLLTTLLLGLLLPILGHYRRKDLLAFIGLIGGLICGGIAFAKAEFTPLQPQSSSLVYLLDQDLKTAQWATYDKHLTEWVKEKLGPSPMTADELSKQTIDSKYRSNFTYASPSPYLPIDELTFNITSDTLIGDQRRIRLEVSSDHPIHRLEVFCDASFIFSEAKVQGIPAYKDPDTGAAFPYRKGNRMISYYVTNNTPLVLDLAFNSDQSPTLKFYAASFDLLENKVLGISPRPDNLMSKPFVLNDAIVRQKSISILD